MPNQGILCPVKKSETLEKKGQKMNLKRYAITGVLCVLAVAMTPRTPTVRSSGFDFDNGNAGVEVIIPRVIPAILSSVSATASDATLVLRTTTIITNAWFDAIAPYHPKAVGVYSRLGRRPANEGATNRNKNIAML